MFAAESKPVEVLVDGSWYPGTLDRWRRCDQRGWIGHVWWRRAAGVQHVEWIKADRLRPLSSSLSNSAGTV